MTERINNPAHYGGADNPYEVIKVIDAWQCNFNTGNALKYMARAGHKPAAGMTLEQKMIEDYGKALWYLEHQLWALSLGCGNAMREQPLIYFNATYNFNTVFVRVGFHAGLADAVKACFNQTSAHRVENGIANLKFVMENLK
jgi:hypothetical protein